MSRLRPSKQLRSAKTWGLLIPAAPVRKDRGKRLRLAENSSQGEFSFPGVTEPEAIRTICERAGRPRRTLTMPSKVKKIPKLTPEQKILQRVKQPAIGTFPGMNRARTFADRKHLANKYACRERVSHD